MNEFEQTKALAEQGHAIAQYDMGWIYYLGWGVERDEAKAVRWWTKAAEQGHASAQFKLSEMYYFGWGVEKDDAEASRWWTKAAEQGHASAQKWVDRLKKQAEIEK